MDWRRTCYSSQWRLFRDDLTKTVKGRYYFAEDDTPPIPVPTYLASAMWDPEPITDAVLGERRGGKRKWSNGVLPVPQPPAVIVTDASCDGFSGLTSDLGEFPLVAGIDVRCWIAGGVDPPPWIPPMISSGWIPVATDVSGIYTDSPLHVVGGCVLATGCVGASYLEIAPQTSPPAAVPGRGVIYADASGVVWNITPGGVTDRWLSFNANLADLINVAEARDHLGLGTAAVYPAETFQLHTGALDELSALAATSVLAYHHASLGWVGLGIGSGLSIIGGSLTAAGGGGTVTSVGITPPAAGITVSGSPVISAGSITLALADDLAALEALAGTNTIYYRSGASAWSAVTIGTGLTFTSGTLAATATPAVETGCLVPFAGSTPPAGYLLCDGSAVSRTTYAALFAVIGTTWGAGDGSTTFNVPDLRGRVPVGAGTGSGLTTRALADTGGNENVFLTNNTVPGG